jgi:KaiC/GvpD/RAD55 family RecA-like ATPase
MNDWVEFRAVCECKINPGVLRGGCPKCLGEGVYPVRVLASDLQDWVMEKLLARPKLPRSPLLPVEREKEIKNEKVTTGTPRLDDLLLGGVPFGSNIVLYGDCFSGKEIMMNAFIADGLRKGVPAVWVLTNKTVDDIRDEMKFLLSDYEHYEKAGLVTYIDAYSLTLEDRDRLPTEDNITYVQSDPQAVTDAVKAVTDKLTEPSKQLHYYRMVFRTISNPVNQTWSDGMFKMLLTVTGRATSHRAVTMYSLHRGMHDEKEAKMVLSTMHGSIEFTVHDLDLDTFLAVRGICDAQSRAFVRYEVDKTGFRIGSFALEALR